MPDAINLARILGDESTDTTPDDMQGIQQSAEDGQWRYYDSGHEECCYPTSAIAIAFVEGKYHSMLLHNPETDMQCGVYDRNGILLDTITTLRG